MDDKKEIITEGKERRWICMSHPDARKKIAEGKARVKRYMELKKLLMERPAEELEEYMNNVLDDYSNEECGAVIKILYKVYDKLCNGSHKSYDDTRYIRNKMLQLTGIKIISGEEVEHKTTINVIDIFLNITNPELRSEIEIFLKSVSTEDMSRISVYAQGLLYDVLLQELTLDDMNYIIHGENYDKK